MALLIPNISLPDEHEVHTLYIYHDGSVDWEKEDQVEVEIGKASEIPDDEPVLAPFVYDPTIAQTDVTLTTTEADT